MIMNGTLADQVKKVLRGQPEKKFTGREIAQEIVKSDPDKYEVKAKKSKQQANVAQQVAAEIGSSRKRIQETYPQIKTTEGRPRQYSWTDKSDETEADEAKQGGGIHTAGTPDGAQLSEHDTYDMLSEYLLEEHGLHSK